MGLRHLDSKLEGDDPTLRFDFTLFQEGGHRRHMAWRRRPKGDGGAAGNIQRWEMSGENGPSGLRRAKRPDRLGAMVGFVMKNQEKEKG
jgi:hypothetical protein